MSVVYIGVCGILGVFARYYAGLWMARWVSSPFPWPTFWINITGSFIIGVVYVLGIEKVMLSNNLRLGIMVGFLGGYTTFSSYALESAVLAGQSRFGVAALYLFGSPVAGFVAALGGILVMRFALGFGIA